MTESEGMGDIISLAERKTARDAATYDDTPVELLAEERSRNGRRKYRSKPRLSELPDGCSAAKSCSYWTTVLIPDGLAWEVAKIQQSFWKADKKRRHHKRGAVSVGYHPIPIKYGDYFFRILGLMRDAKIAPNQETSKDILELIISRGEYSLPVNAAIAAYGLDKIYSEFFDAQGNLRSRDSSQLH